MVIDSHCHLSRKNYDGEFPGIVSEQENERIQRFTRDALISKMKEQGVAFIIEPAVEFETNFSILSLADQYPDFVFPAVGIHPTRTFTINWKMIKELEKVSCDKRVIALGETGIDLHYERNEQHRLKQIISFLWHIFLADKRQLPLILHIRNADKEAVRILRLFKKRLHGGVCHCFNGDKASADVYTKEFGLFLGIGGALLQDGAEELLKAVKETPLEYIILETDVPYVRPKKPELITSSKWFKARNTSLIIHDIAKKIADIKGIDVSEVERVTTENVKRLFKVDAKY